MYTFLELLYILELYVHCKQENYSTLGRLIRCWHSPRSLFTYFPNYLSCPITKNSKFFPVIANHSLNEHIANKTYINCISILPIKWKWSRTFLRKLSLFIIKPTIYHPLFLCKFRGFLDWRNGWIRRGTLGMDIYHAGNDGHGLGRVLKPYKRLL